MVLEMINETLLVVFMYIGLSSSVLYEIPETQWTIGYVAICHSGFIILANLALMVMHGLKSLSDFCKKKRAAAKALKAKKLAQESLAFANSQSTGLESFKKTKF